MRSTRWLALTGSLGLAVSVLAAAPGVASARTAHPTHQAHGNAAALQKLQAQERSHPAGPVTAGSSVSFDLVLSLRNPSGAASFAREVSAPGSAQFHHYLTDAQWAATYGPAKAEVTKATAWLRKEGLTVGAVPADRLFVPAEGTAHAIEHAFGIQLGYYKLAGRTVRLAKGTIAVPTSLAGSVTGTVGINDYIATNALSTGAAEQTAATKPDNSTKEPGPPAGFRNSKPCSAYWGQLTDTTDSGDLYQPYVYPEPYDICGYKPAQLRGAYDLNGAVAKGDDGKGVTIAIVDAYDSPHLLANAQEYFRLNDPKHPLLTSQFTNDEPASINSVAECDGNGWYAEQSLDVETTHSMAPGAHLEYVGAQSCLNPGLLAAENTAITSGAQVVSNSWLETLGDVFDDVSTHTAFDNAFLLADGTGVSVLFCTGDNGDNFADFGLTIPDYPASSPYVTAVGGTTVEVGATSNREAEYGWSTARQVLCVRHSANCGTATTPEGPMTYQEGAGGGTSYYYAEPTYQDAVVPSDLSLRNEAVTGEAMRVLPDVAMDADPQSGLLIGLTQSFPNGSYYAQFKEGGTSLATPTLAGVIADTDQMSGTSLGFLNPELYKAGAASPAAFNDITAPANPDAAAVVRVDFNNSVNGADGYIMSLRAINYAGPETFCDTTGNCETRDVTLTTGPGFDSLTGLGSTSAKFISILSKF
ncbi:MAG: S53 family peptidase [Streptosporangiaceae bacterium]